MSVLITGMSGTGKSSLLAELTARGYRTVDTDYGDFHEIVDGESQWRVDRIEALLSEQSGVLSAPALVLVERLLTRDANPYGKAPAELAETLENLDAVEPLLRAAATLEVVTTVPVEQVADLVLAHVATDP